MSSVVSFCVLSRLSIASFVLFSSLLCAQSGSISSGPGGQSIDKPTEGAEPASSSGVATGSPHPVQLDSHQRPITAGGFVSSGPVIFQDISEEAGITHSAH